MHEVQARTRLPAPLIKARTVCRLIFQRRWVMLWAWLTLCPNCGPLPQMSQTLAINSHVSTSYCSVGGYLRPMGSPSSTARLAALMSTQTPRNRDHVLFSLPCVASNASQQLPALTIWPRCRSASARQQIERESRHLPSRRCTVPLLPVASATTGAIERSARSAILKSLDDPRVTVNRQGVRILVYQRLINRNSG